MPYDPTNWKDEPNKTTPVSAANLNKIEDCLVEVTSRELKEVTPMNDIWGRGKIAKFSHSCMFDLSFKSPLAIGGETEIFQFPIGYRPYIDFSVAVINSSTYEYVGIAEYDATRNMLTFKSPIQDEVFCRLSCFYVTIDKPQDNVQLG